MAKINQILDKVLAFIDKNSTIVIIIAAGILLYKQFGSLFSFLKKESDNKQQAQAEHTQAIVAQTKAVPAKSTDPKKQTERRKIINDNAKIASLKFDSTCAEEIRKHTKFLPNDVIGLFWTTKKPELMKIANSIAKYSGNLTNIAAEYKKAFNDDMYADVRNVMGSDYITWLSTASKK